MAGEPGLTETRHTTGTRPVRPCRDFRRIPGSNSWTRFPVAFSRPREINAASRGRGATSPSGLAAPPRCRIVQWQDTRLWIGQRRFDPSSGSDTAGPGPASAARPGPGGTRPWPNWQRHRLEGPEVAGSNPAGRTAGAFLADLPLICPGVGGTHARLITEKTGFDSRGQDAATHRRASGTLPGRTAVRFRRAGPHGTADAPARGNAAGKVGGVR